MKTKTYILTFFMLLSGVAFGQDSIYVKSNEYGLDRIEKDSIFNSVYLQEKTQQLLENYEKGIDKDIFLPENHSNFLSVLNSSLVHYKKKRKFLIERIQHDEKTIITKKRNIKTHSDLLTIPKSTNQRQSVRIEQPYYSKEEALTQFVSGMNSREYLDFSYCSVWFFKMNEVKSQPQSFRIPKEKDFLLSKKTIRKIKRLRIIEIDYIPNNIGINSGHGGTEMIGQLVIFHE